MSKSYPAWVSQRSNLQIRTVLALVACSAALAAQPVPHIAAVVSAADFNPGVTFSGYATIFGTALSDAARSAQSLPYPQELGTTQVFLCYSVPVPFDQAANIITFLGCVPTALVYASPSQINFLIPSTLPSPPKLVGLDGKYVFIVSVAGVIDQDAAAAVPKEYSLQSPQPRIFFEGYDCFGDPRFQDANNNCGLTLTQGATYQASRGP
jgi:hypothetical protein